MAKIEMDVTEYDALRKNITLLEESKKEAAELNKQIDALKEEKLQVFRDMQMKVVKQSTVEHIIRTVGVRGTPEFNTLVRVIVEGICNRISRSDYISRSESERRYQHAIRKGHDYDYDSPSHFHAGSMQAASPMEFVEYELSSFLNRLITKESEPIYIGLEEVKTELYAKLVSNQTTKTKDLLALEPAFNDFNNKKAKLESMTNTLLKEKLELDTKLVSASQSNSELRKQNDKINEIQHLYEGSLSDMSAILNGDYFFVKTLKTDLTSSLTKVKEEIKKIKDESR